MSEEKKECRICFDEGTDDDPLISPCKCKGTSAYVHKSCLSNWRNFNRNSEAWNICMECHAEYIISRKYPIENFLYDTRYKLPVIYFSESMFGFSGGLLIWYIEYNTDYLAVKMLNFNNEEKNEIIIQDLLKNGLIPQVFYYNFTFLFISIFFCIRFYYNYNKIKRKNIYWKQMKTLFYSNLIFNLHFVFLYYIFLWNNLEIIFYNFSTVLTFLIPYSHYKMLKHHNIVIRDMNAENEEEVLSFIHNPLLNNGYEIELINVIID